MMSHKTSPSIKKPYGLKRVCQTWKVPRSTVYDHRKRKASQILKHRPGPKPKISNEEVLSLIRQDIKNSPFHGEGHRKIHARINRHTKVSRERIRKVMRENKLLSPYRVAKGVEKSHNGRITTDEPNVMWGTDGTKILTLEGGWVWLFAIVDHWNGECMGWHLVKKGSRFAALEAAKMALNNEYGGLDRDIARGLSLRLDNGSQYRSEDFMKQAKYWGIALSFGFVREPETNGVIERFNRTFKEQVIHGQVYRTIDELHRAIEKFMEDYNRLWLLEKLKYQSPKEAREAWRRKKNAA